jgi:DNA-binding MarR family transcriptional regulator
MEDVVLAKIVENLLNGLPLIHRKLTSVLNEGGSKGLSHYHFAILGVLSKSNSLPVSEIGRRLMISKPQMTAIIDRLVELNLVNRHADTEDRRITHIELTTQGKEELILARQQITQNVERKLANLNKEDLELLSGALQTLTRISSKIE